MTVNYLLLELISLSFSGRTLTATLIFAGAELTVEFSGISSLTFSFPPAANLEIGRFLNGERPLAGDLFKPVPDLRLDLNLFIFEILWYPDRFENICCSNGRASNLSPATLFLGKTQRLFTFLISSSIRFTRILRTF